MKCDELEAYGMNDPAIGDEYEMYKVSDVDAAIAELKAIVTTDNSAVIARLEEQLRKTQRALWMARHERACAVAQWHLTLSEYEEANKWDKVVQKTLAKAKEYE